VAPHADRCGFDIERSQVLNPQQDGPNRCPDAVHNRQLVECEANLRYVVQPAAAPHSGDLAALYVKPTPVRVRRHCQRARIACFVLQTQRGSYSEACLHKRPDLQSTDKSYCSSCTRASRSCSKRWQAPGRPYFGAMAVRSVCRLGHHCRRHASRILHLAVSRQCC
jgi:hypothetical protein